MAAAKKKGGVLKVSAPLVQIRLGNKIVHLFDGDIVPEGASPESLDHLLGLGYVTEGDAPVESDEK